MNTRETIENILKEIIPGIDVSSNDIMNEQGVESLMMIQIISELDIAFDIEITFEDIENNSFHSVEAIENMVLSHMK